MQFPDMIHELNEVDQQNLGLIQQKRVNLETMLLYQVNLHRSRPQESR